MTPRQGDELVLDFFDTPLLEEEVIVDLFAGGGGASLGIEWATGRSPDEAVNHSSTALAIHEANHPKTRHHHSDIWEVDPVEVVAGRRVGLLWASPDCTHFSKAKGAVPLSKKIRMLAHAIIRWATKVHPRVIVTENVEEFLGWGPIDRETSRPDPARKGASFRGWLRQLRRLGYVVEWRLLRGCDYGSPTTRRRLFIIARCDGQPIVWPAPTHGPARAQPWRTAAECIDFTLPCLSIFATKAEARELGFPRAQRPLVDATLRRIARGIDRFVINAAEPFLVEYHSAKREGDDRVRGIHEPMPTATTENRFGIVAPLLVPRYGERVGQDPRALRVDRPLPTIVPSANGSSLVCAFLAKHYGGNETPGSHLAQPIDTITETDHHALVASSLVKLKGTCRDGHPLTEPMATVQAQGNHLAEVRAFLVAYYGTEKDGGSLRAPMRTVTPKDRLALVTVHGVDYAIVDIGMRMLTARELANGQGFPPSYILEAPIEKAVFRGRGAKRREVTVRETVSETAQKEMVGNSVNPHVAAAIVRANLGARVAQERAA